MTAKRLAKGQLVWYMSHHPEELVPARYLGPDGTGGHTIMMVGPGIGSRLVGRSEIVTKEERDLIVTKEVLDS